MKVSLKTLGCRLNEAELEQWASGFQDEGHSLTSKVDEADLIVLNTCAVTQEAVKKSKQFIRRAHRNNPRAKLIVSGCYASLTPGLKNDIAGIDLLIPNAKKDKLVDIVKQELSISAMPSLATAPGEAALFSLGRNRAFVKVQDGCRYRCTFCIVTVARGQEHSRATAEIIDEINALHSRGIQEVILTGVHIGGYGSDLGSDLFHLLKAVLAETSIPRIRLGSVEPWDLSDDFFSLFENRRFMPHLHLPLQSGSDKVLKRMGRRCKTSDFENMVAAARASIAGFNVTTDIIVGFPGESQDDWKNSLSFIEKIGFSHLHIFPYSPRAGTRAATLPEHIPHETKKARSQELHTLAESMKKKFLQSQTGGHAQVLFEHSTKEAKNGTVYCGYTANYVRAQVTLPADSPVKNTIQEVKLTGINAKGDALLAQMENEGVDQAI